MVFSFILSIRLLNRFFAHGTRLYLGIRFWSSLERQCILQLPFVPSIPICILSNIRTSLAEYSLHLWLPISPRPFRTRTKQQKCKLHHPNWKQPLLECQTRFIT
uniref:Uncharacterized protein n=1 Tax=Rhizophora mucronata TaxID=61149 RepID=A0A2P2KG83_RHIMU